MNALICAVVLAANSSSHRAKEASPLPLNALEVGAGFVAAGDGLVKQHGGTPAGGATEGTRSGSANGLDLRLHVSAWEPLDGALFQGGPGADAWLTLGLTGDSTVKSTGEFQYEPTTSPGDWGLDLRFAFPWSVFSYRGLHLGVGPGAQAISKGMPGYRGVGTWLNLTASARLLFNLAGVKVRLEADQGLFGAFTPSDRPAEFRRENQLQVRALVGSVFHVSAMALYTTSTSTTESVAGLIGGRFTSSAQALSLGLVWTFGGED